MRGAPRGRGGQGFQQRNISVPERTPYSQQQGGGEYRNNYQQQNEGLKRPPMGMAPSGAPPKRGRYDEQQQADPYQAGYDILLAFSTRFEFYSSPTQDLVFGILFKISLPQLTLDLNG
jgi:hypothetical protein